LIAAAIRKPWAWITAIILMFCIGISRIALGMHFYLDVMTGWLIGAIILWLFLRFEKPVGDWMNKKSIGLQLVILFVISIAILIVGQLIQILIGSWEIPTIWLQNATNALPDDPIEPFSMSGIVSNAAILFGLVGGAVLMKERGGFEVKAKFWKLLLRYIIGLIGVVIIWAGLDMIFPDGHDFIAYAFRYLRYGLAGLWMSLGAPWIFIRFKLAEPAQG